MITVTRTCLRWITCRRSLCNRKLTTPAHHLASAQIAHHHLQIPQPINAWYSVRHFTTNDTIIDNVRKGLNCSDELKDKLIDLFQLQISSNNSLSKCNSEFKLSGDEVYTLAVAVFNVLHSRGSDVAHATDLFRYSHELNNINASYSYAQLLRIGQGCESDPKKAGEIFTTLALKGHPYAQFALGTMYHTGIGMEQNLTRAFTLYKVSGRNLVPESFRALGDMYYEGTGIDKNVNEAFDCYKRAVELGDNFAHLSLARCYDKGVAVEQSYEKSFEHYLAAAEAGIPMAIFNVGVQYFAGKGVGQSFEKAKEYFLKASDLGFVPAQVNLGNMYYGGHGVEQDKAKAIEFYKMAAVTDEYAKSLLAEVEQEAEKLSKVQE